MISRSAFDDIDFHARVSREEIYQQLAGFPARDRCDNPKAQLPLGSGPTSRSRLNESVYFRENYEGLSEDALAGRCGLHALTLPLEKTDADRVLQSANLPADDRWPDTERNRGFPETSRLTNQ